MRFPILPLLALSLLALPPVMGQDGVRARAQTSDRHMARVLFFAMKDGRFAGIPAQYTINYGSAEWKDSYEKSVEGFKGKQVRWRFGSDAWTTLDTNVALEIGGKKVEPGIYYLVLEHTKDDKMHLVLLDPKEVMAKKYDAFQANSTTGGLAVPLTHESGQKEQAEFTIKFVTDENETTKSTLHVRWGGHHLHAPVKAML